MTRFEGIRLFIVSVALLIIAAVPAQAQKLGPDGAPNPTASVTDRRTHRHSRPQGQRAGAAGWANMGLFPRGAAALGRRSRDRRYNPALGPGLFDHRASPNCGRALRT